MAQLIIKWVTSCDQCVKESRINNKFKHQPLQNPNDYITGPENTNQVDLVTELPPSGGYEDFVTGMNVFSRYLFAYSTPSQHAKLITRFIFNNMTKHAYWATTILCCRGSAIASQVIKRYFWSSQNYLTACQNKARTNFWNARTNVNFAPKRIKDWSGRTMTNVAQTSTSILQSQMLLLHDLLQEKWVWA